MRRQVYYYDYEGDFGLSGLAKSVVSRSALRLDAPTVLALAARAAADDDVQLGTDVRLLLGSPLPEPVLRTVWLAAVRRCFDPAEAEGEVRAWLRRLSDACPQQARELDPYEAAALDEVRPTVTEEALREIVTAEVEEAVPALERAVAVPGLAPALRDVVHQVDADLGFRLFLRAAKAYSVPFAPQQYDRLRTIGDRLAYPPATVHEDLTVRWPPLDAGQRDFPAGRFGLPMLAAVFRGTDWHYEGTERQHIQKVAQGGDHGHIPGSYAAVLLEDAQRLLDCPLPDTTITTLWHAVTNHWHTTDDFDRDGRPWLEQIARQCREYLADVDPVYTPVVTPARTDLAEPVLREIHEIAPLLAGRVIGGGPTSDRDAVTALQAAAASADPDLAFRLFLATLGAYDVPVDPARFARYQALGRPFGYSEDHVDDWLIPCLP
ncbi:hypothetical protein GTY54_15190 [Streptomyces sp. SID625]|nr:hypothetical protein [Streptomyces sp. SID625]